MASPVAHHPDLQCWHHGAGQEAPAPAEAAFAEPASEAASEPAPVAATEEVAPTPEATKEVKAKKGPKSLKVRYTFCQAICGCVSELTACSLAGSG